MLQYCRNQWFGLTDHSVEHRRHRALTGNAALGAGIGASAGLAGGLLINAWGNKQGRSLR
jgi:hypothetical protein